ncbi:MAG: lipopolysaccharide core heptose(II) kinase RfaY [Halodesulfurarchaeum sp.]
MSVRRYLRGAPSWEVLEAVGRELAEAYDRPVVRLEFLESENWLSTPLVLDREFFVKVITPRNAFVHALITGARNIGAFSSGTAGFFEHFEDPHEMARHELQATRRIREAGVNAPEPIETFEVGSVGVLVLDYLEGFRTLDLVSESTVRGQLQAVFESLATMHEEGIAHGDLRAENLLLVDGDVYVIDATAVDAGALPEAKAYDLACALGTLEPIVGASDAVDAAASVYPTRTLVDTIDFLDFVNIRPDHDFDAASLKGEITTVAEREEGP